MCGGGQWVKESSGEETERLWKLPGNGIACSLVAKVIAHLLIALTSTASEEEVLHLPTASACLVPRWSV